MVKMMTHLRYKKHISVPEAQSTEDNLCYFFNDVFISCSGKICAFLQTYALYLVGKYTLNEERGGLINSVSLLRRREAFARNKNGDSVIVRKSGTG